MKIDKNLIKELSEYLNEFNLTEIEFTEKDTKIKVSKNNISINNQTIPVTQKSSILLIVLLKQKI
jgi:acetyl-CoA carboxylase biotin carboxyl carrier protein